MCLYTGLTMRWTKCGAMPFGLLKLKKSRNYSVVSKSLCVIIVKLLENGTVECILSSRTIGHECLDNVCQRLQIAQTEYFGLRYATKDGSQRWVDLDRPLKKQLDKYAQEFSLTLGIMFYVFNVDHLSDEPTRYYYFSHLKSDILEGRLRCNREEAVQLASFSLQAEFGDHRPEHHTPEYLKNFVLVPKYLTGVAGGNQGDQLLEEIIKAHQSLHGTPHAVAELYYLMAVQRLEGYGEELFNVKDQIGQDVTLGVSALGVTVRYPSRIQHEQSMAYQWSEIVDLIHHKKFFKVEGRDTNCCAQFQLDDVITAKYIWKQCVQQHKFYMQMKQLEADSNGNAAGPFVAIAGGSSSRDKEVIKNQHAINEGPMRSPLVVNNNNNNTNNNAHSLGSLDDLDSGVYNTETQTSHIGQQQQITGGGLQVAPPNSTPCVSTAGSGPRHVTQMIVTQLMVAKEEPDYENVSMLLANSEEVRRALLPDYRKAPDYEQAIRMKYQISASLNDLSYGSSAHRCHHSTQGHQHNHHNRLYGNYASSIPSSNIDISPTSKSYNPLMPLNSYSQYGQYSTDLQAIGNSSQELVGVYSRQISKTTSNLPYQTAMHTQYNSTPELNINLDRRQSAVLPGARDLYPIEARVAITTSTGRGTSTSVPDLTQSLNSCHSSFVQIQTAPDVIGQSQLQHADLSRSRLSSDSSSTHTSATHTPLQSASRYTSNSNGGSSNTPNNNNPTCNNSKPSTTATVVTVNNQKVAYQSYNSETSAKEANITKVQVTSTHYSSDRTALAAVSPTVATSTANSTSATVTPSLAESHSRSSNVLAGPMLLAAMNGLAGPSVKPDILENVHDSVMVEKMMDEPPKDSRIQDLETKLAGGHVFQEFEQIVKKKPMANFATAMLAENMPRNRFKDVLPYEENRVRLGPSKDNRTGYINASHVSVSIGEMHRFYIAAQGPMANTCFHFWQMIWENNTAIIVMLTDVVEGGKEKCHPYWPQADDSRVTFKDFVVTRKTTYVSSTFTTCALQVQYLPTRVTRTVYHLQYTDWPDHGCPLDIHGFLSFMEEIESVRRLVLSEQNLAQNRAVRNAPVVMHCTAGVGRSGVVILCDLLLFCLDHNHPIDVPQALTYIRYQRMLSVQTLAQYKFVYQVLIQYLKNSRLI
ncbi:tyrosine-protein phosphatase non-receptor type 21-like isoform X1 [Varroa jacobsoni]|uniref:protein-tyrosine-phosphatase n=2 Tax=Varroa destructor TaxID=109461 RepID=A0A7M7J4V8_VARDE|nr:tyrosine-protein phosphatase non-receptor type 21-like isoform X1 [Varroa destructor]XP_022690919.1 tyrosine-protein phosphatase non-receptor type 21-like isoform X1 [Varroa jacobsoni]